MAASDVTGTRRERSGAFDHLIHRDDRRHLGEALRRTREAAGVQQGDLAARLGVSQAVLSKIESAHREVTVLELNVICAALGVPLTEVLEQLAKPPRTHRLPGPQKDD